MENDDGEFLTTGQFAKRFKMSREKVRGLVREGSLEAINVAAKSSTRPRFLIPKAAEAAFLAARTFTPAVPERRRQRKNTDPDVPSRF